MRGYVSPMSTKNTDRFDLNVYIEKLTYLMTNKVLELF